MDRPAGAADTPAPREQSAADAEGDLKKNRGLRVREDPDGARHRHPKHRQGAALTHPGRAIPRKVTYAAEPEGRRRYPVRIPDLRPAKSIAAESGKRLHVCDRAGVTEEVRTRFERHSTDRSNGDLAGHWREREDLNVYDWTDWSASNGGNAPNTPNTPGTDIISTRSCTSDRRRENLGVQTDAATPLPLAVYWQPSASSVY